MNEDNYPDGQIRLELLNFFSSWKHEDVFELSSSELDAWKRHAISLREAGFWWHSTMESQQEPSSSSSEHSSSSLGWC